MIGDWIFDHFGWLLAAVTVIVVGFTIWAVASGGLDCPKGQHLQVVTYVPIVVGKVVTMTPVYDCVPGHG